MEEIWRKYGSVCKLQKTNAVMAEVKKRLSERHLHFESYGGDDCRRAYFTG